MLPNLSTVGIKSCSSGECTPVIVEPKLTISSSGLFGGTIRTRTCVDSLDGRLLSEQLLICLSRNLHYRGSHVGSPSRIAVGVGHFRPRELEMASTCPAMSFLRDSTDERCDVVTLILLSPSILTDARFVEVSTRPSMSRLMEMTPWGAE